MAHGTSFALNPEGTDRETPLGYFLRCLNSAGDLLKLQRFDEALEVVETAIRIRPGDGRARGLLATVHYHLHNYDEAIALYRELLSAFPAAGALRVNLGLCYLKSGHLTAARAEFESITTTHPDHARAWGYLGICCEKLGEYDAAIRAFEQGGHNDRSARLLQRRRPSRTVASQGNERNAQFEPGHQPGHHYGIGIRSERGSSLLSGMEELVDDIGLDSMEETPGNGPLYPSSPPRQASPWATAAANEANPRPRFPTPSTSRRDSVDAFPPPRPTVLPPLSTTMRRDSESRLVFPTASVVIHPTGLALTQIGLSHENDVTAFAARLSSLGLLGGQLTTSLLQRQRRGPPSPEPFGGAATPLVRIEGSGQIAVEPREGHYLVPLFLHEAACFFESVLAAFELSLSYENLALAGEPLETTPLVQFRGSGMVILEIARKLVAVDASSEGGPLTIRRERVVGWTGILHARSLPPAETFADSQPMLHLQGQGTIYFTVVP